MITLACGTTGGTPGTEGQSGGAGGMGATGGSAGTTPGDGPDGPSGVPIGGDCSRADCVGDAVCTSDPCESSGYSECPWTCKRRVPNCGTGACSVDEYCTTDTYGFPGRSYCSPRVKAGDPCDSLQADCCESGYYCALDAVQMSGPRCAKRGEDGDPCSPPQQDSCAEGYRCEPTGAQAECVALVALHGKCMNTFQCAKGLFCSLDTDTCEVVSQAGEDCRPTSWSCAGIDCVALSVYCADGLVCVPKAAPSGCFSDHDCGAEFCCADENNVGSCQPDAFCKAPLGKCISH